MLDPGIVGCGVVLRPDAYVGSTRIRKCGGGKDLDVDSIELSLKELN